MPPAVQSLTVDYLASGSLDGSTPAPRVTRGNSGTPFSLTAQIYQPLEVANIGTIDPDLGAGGSTGPRYISQFLVDLAGVVAPGGARVVVAAQRGDTLVELEEVLDLAGKSVAFAAPFIVPQGAVIVLTGVAAGPDPILVRVSIDNPADPALVSATLAASQPAGDINKILQLNPRRFYQDNPPAGTVAKSYAVPHGGGTLKLATLSARVDFPYGPGESSSIRLFRYRKTAPGGAFSIAQITDTFVFNNTYDWSWTYPLDGLIRDGFDLNPLTDSVAVSNVQVNGAAPTARALRVDYTYEQCPAGMTLVVTPSATPGVPAWDPS